MGDITGDILRAFLDDPNNETRRVHASMVITLRDNRGVTHEMDCNMEADKVVFGDSDLTISNPRIISYKHRRYRQ